MTKKCFSFLLVLFVLSSFITNSFSLAKNTPMNKVPNMVKELNKQIKHSALKNVKIERISFSEQNKLENFINGKQEIINLNRKLKKDGFKKINYTSDKVIKIVGGNHSSILYYVMNAYENKKMKKL